MPASSANLGPGFDSVGLALGLWDTCRATPSRLSPASSSRCDGEGAGSVPADAHPPRRTAPCRPRWGELGVAPPAGLLLECHNEVPHGRGLGSSATAIVTGIVAAQACTTPPAGGRRTTST